MLAETVRKTIFKMGWDTRCRNADVERIVRPLIDHEATILDAGCGEYGLAAFLAADRIVGVDIVPSNTKGDGFTFVHGSIISLPFAERSFSIAASVDVLEHLPQDIRADAIKQIVRAASKSIIITFPSGEAARAIDEAFNAELVASNQSIPDWLAEHLANQYPTAAAVLAEIEKEAAGIGRAVRTTIHYSENIAIAKYLRWSAARSRYLYLVSNLAAGFLLPVLPRATKENAYRAIVLAEFV